MPGPCSGCSAQNESGCVRRGLGSCLLQFGALGRPHRDASVGRSCMGWGLPGVRGTKRCPQGGTGGTAQPQPSLSHQWGKKIKFCNPQKEFTYRGCRWGAAALLLLVCRSTSSRHRHRNGRSPRDKVLWLLALGTSCRCGGKAGAPRQQWSPGSGMWLLKLGELNVENNVSSR